MFTRFLVVRLPLAAILVVALAPLAAHAAVHLWHIKEVFSNADGSVQFIELFNNFNSEQFTSGTILRANSDGTIKNFTLTANLSSSSTAGRHMLIATPGFGSLPGGVTPTFTLPNPAVNGPFFNPNANTLTFTFTGSGEVLSFAGSLLPKDGFHSLTDANTFDFPQSTSNLSVTENSPTTFSSTTAGKIDLRVPETTGDYNGNGVVDAADYTVWRNSFGLAVGLGTGADGKADGVIDQQDYAFWKSRFGTVIGSPGSASASAVVIPEPAILALTITGLMALAVAARRARQSALKS